MYEISVRDFVELCLESNSLEFKVYDLDSERQVFQGFISDCPKNIAVSIVESFDAPNLADDGIITLNVSLEN